MPTFSFMINSAPTHPGSAIYVLKIPWEDPGRKLPGKSWPPEQGCPDVGGGRDETRMEGGGLDRGLERRLGKGACREGGGCLCEIKGEEAETGRESLRSQRRSDKGSTP